MKLRLLALATLPLLSLGMVPMGSSTPAAPASQPSTRPARSQGGITNPPNLERAMKTMNRLLDTVKNQVDDPAQDAATLAAVNNLQVFTVLAKVSAPDSVGELVGDAKTTAIADYHQRMNGLIRAELALEEAILRNDRKAAHEAIQKLADQRKDGHDAYDVDDKNH